MLFIRFHKLSLSKPHLQFEADQFLEKAVFENTALNGAYKNAFIVLNTVSKSSVFVSIFRQNAFHFFCIASSLPKVMTCSNCSTAEMVPTVFKGLFQSFRQHCAVKIELVCEVIKVVIVFHPAGELHQ